MSTATDQVETSEREVVGTLTLTEQTAAILSIALRNHIEKLNAHKAAPDCGLLEAVSMLAYIENLL